MKRNVNREMRGGVPKRRPGPKWAFQGEMAGFESENAKSCGKLRNRDGQFATSDDASVHLTLQ